VTLADDLHSPPAARRRGGGERSVQALAQVLRHLLRSVLQPVVAALPPRWLPAMAHALSRLRWVFLARMRQHATEALALALGHSQPEGAVRRVLREAFELATLDALTCLHARSPAWRAAVASLESVLAPTSRRRELFLSARLGWSELLGVQAARLGLRLAWIEREPRRAGDAATLEWLGRVTLVDLSALRRAFARGASVRLLLLLSDETGRPLAWASPVLGGPDGDSEQGEPAALAAQQALDALACLVRALPEVLDWTAARWSLRPEIARDGHASWSRLAPWLASRRRPGSITPS